MIRLATSPALFILFSSEHTAHRPVGGHGAELAAVWLAVTGGVGMEAELSLAPLEEVPQARQSEAPAKSESFPARTL